MLSSAAPRIMSLRFPQLVGGIKSKVSSATVRCKSSAAAAVTNPMEVFDMLDRNKDGSICREDFQTAVEKLHYDDLLKIKESLARNELSYNPDAEQDKLESTTHENVLLRRIKVTAEVTVSKIIPAGFGWQTFATIGESAGMQATDMSFFLTTGFGDGLFVLAGHTMWMAGKKMVTGDQDINITHQAQTGLMLGSAAFCSGSVWQPAVNAMQDANWSFEPSVLGTVGVCSLAFFTGLRLSRYFYAPIMEGVEAPNYANLEADAQLSVAVGGATGCFLGTDVSYEAANWLRPVVGIEEFHDPVTASFIAGSSTGLGFSVVQMGQNLVYPKDQCWVD